MNNKILLITGASSDMGIELIKRCYNNYDYIVAHYNKNKDQLEQLINICNDKLVLLQADFSNISDVNNLIKIIEERELYPTDIVHFPAADYEILRFIKMDWEMFQNEINISLKSIILILKKFLPRMAKNKYGKLVIMLSASTINVPPKYMTYYVTVKYALLGLMKALAAEYVENGIFINGVSPDMTKTKFLNNIPEIAIQRIEEDSPNNRLLTVEEVIPTIEFLLSEGANCISGQNICITR